ncbi:MAG: hypothetical protein HRT45_05645 [Bdellovibrionales bacterium]|nr:hypothetical protein [Bdellovibrionales bacterium]
MAAMHFEASDGYRKPVPKCSPLSYLTQYSFSEAEMRKIDDSLAMFTEVQAMSSTLKLPNEQRFHLVVSQDTDDQLATRLLRTILARGSDLEETALDVISGFYGQIIENALVGRSDSLVNQADFVSDWGAGEKARVVSSMLHMFFERLEPLDRPEMLVKLWQQPGDSTQSDKRSVANDEGLPKMGKLVSLALDFVNSAPVDSSLIEELSDQKAKVHSKASALLSVPKVVRVKTENSELLSGIKAALLAQRPMLSLLETQNEKLLYPKASEFVSELSAVQTADLILVQCDSPSLQQTSDKQFKQVYFIEVCSDADVEFVTQKLISYLKASPGSEPRLDSTKFSFVE